MPLLPALERAVARQGSRAAATALQLVAAEDTALAANQQRVTFLAEAISLHLARVVYVDGDYVIRQVQP